MPQPSTGRAAYLCALRRRDRAAWLRKVAATIDTHDGNLSAAQRALRISRATMWRWLRSEPELYRHASGKGLNRGAY